MSAECARDRHRAALCSVLGMMLIGCDDAPTGIRLHVYSDLGSNLSGVHVRVTPSLDDGGVVAPFDGGVPVGLDDTFPVRPPGSPLDDPRAPMPLDIGMAPFAGLGPISNRSILIDVDAEGAPCTLHVRRMRRFESGRIVHVYAELTEDCCGVVCPADYSCGFGGYCTPDDPTVPRECSTAAPEWCDGLDNDCDPNVDEGTRECGDGVCANTVPLCIDGRFNPCAPLPPDYSMCGTGVDADCDGAVEEGPRLTSYADRDRDGYGDPRTEVYGCAERPTGSVAGATDCDDFDASVHPGATATCGIGECRRTVETCVGGVRQNCTPARPTPESCNNLDDDCNGVIDEFPGCYVACNWSGARFLSHGWDGGCAFRVGAWLTCTAGRVAFIEWVDDGGCGPPLRTRAAVGVTDRLVGCSGWAGDHWITEGLDDDPAWCFGARVTCTGGALTAINYGLYDPSQAGLGPPEPHVGFGDAACSWLDGTRSLSHGWDRSTGCQASTGFALTCAAGRLTHVEYLRGGCGSDCCGSNATCWP